MSRRPNIYSDAGLDRSDHYRADGTWLNARLVDRSTRFLVFRQGRPLLDCATSDSPQVSLLTSADSEMLLRLGAERIFLGTTPSGRALFALDLSGLDSTIDEPMLRGRGTFEDLRRVGPLLPQKHGARLAYARALLHWHHRHRYCGQCGTATESRHGGHQRVCTNADCGAVHFPRTDPAVIMLVHDGGERCVLAHGVRLPPGMYSTLAGFVEPGESLEEAVIREVREEVGLEVVEASYHSSQPWPFPSQLMLGFQARALHAELQLQAEEIESARWFSRDELRRMDESEHFRLPRRDSIARRLIEDWLARVPR